MIGDVMRTQRTPRLRPAACSLTRFSYLLRAANIWLGRTANPENTVLTPAEDYFFGWWSWTYCEWRVNTTLSLSPTRTSTEFGLAGISCFPRVNQTSQWTWLIALLPLLQDVVCLLPHASQWILPDTVVPAIENSHCMIYDDLRKSDTSDLTTESLWYNFQIWIRG